MTNKYLCNLVKLSWPLHSYVEDVLISLDDHPIAIPINDDGSVASFKSNKIPWVDIVDILSSSSVLLNYFYVLCVMQTLSRFLALMGYPAINSLSHFGAQPLYFASTTF